MDKFIKKSEATTTTPTMSTKVVENGKSLKTESAQKYIKNSEQNSTKKQIKTSEQLKRKIEEEIDPAKDEELQKPQSTPAKRKRLTRNNEDDPRELSAKTISETPGEKKVSPNKSDGTQNTKTAEEEKNDEANSNNGGKSRSKRGRPKGSKNPRKENSEQRSECSSKGNKH